jgi:hypothetical protein
LPGYEENGHGQFVMALFIFGCMLPGHASNPEHTYFPRLNEDACVMHLLLSQNYYPKNDILCGFYYCFHFIILLRLLKKGTIFRSDHSGYTNVP